VDGLIEAAVICFWSDDPFARGAYSFVPVGAGQAAHSLATPVSQTLFFAGEATETEGHSATVHGAILTGVRAADAVSASLRGRTAASVV
jgi:monoamine oxidase